MKINKNKLKYGSFSTVIIIVVLVAVVVLNILMSALNERGFLKFDATASGKYTISEENEKFIKKIDKDVKITVLSNESQYLNIGNFAYQYYGVSATDEDYDQTLKLLARYPEINDKIKLEFVDFYGSQAKAIAEKHPSVFYGDILITAKVGDIEKEKLVSFADIYTYQSDQYTGTAEITENNTENAISSAINTMLYGAEKNIALISSHSTPSVFNEYYSKSLSLNGFNATEIKDAVISSIDKNLDAVVIAAPTSDLLPEEITALNTWLNNDGNMGKSFIFLPGGTLTNFPNLREFLEEWGIKYSAGTVYQTDSQYYYGEPTTTFGFVQDNETAKKIVEDAESFTVLGSNVPMEKAFESFDSITPTVIMSTNDMATIKPEGADENWAPSGNYEKKSYATIILSENLKIVDNNPKRSYVVAFSSFESVYSQWAQYDKLLNLDSAVNTTLYATGTDIESAMTFVPKSITSESFADRVTAAKTAVIVIIFVVLIPQIIIALGIVVFIRRRKK